MCIEYKSLKKAREREKVRWGKKRHDLSCCNDREALVWVLLEQPHEQLHHPAVAEEEAAAVAIQTRQES